jgi:hypothetical protein
MSEVGLRLAALVIVLGLSGCGDTASSPPPPGVYHVDLMSELVTNVEIDPRGTFRWGGGGCDTVFYGGGQWRAIDDRLVLTPIDDNKDFEWAVVVRNGAPILIDDRFERLEIAAGTREGELIISGLGERWGDYSASWLAGGFCGTGCGRLSAPCEEPYVGSCYGNSQPAYCHPDMSLLRTPSTAQSSMFARSGSSWPTPVPRLLCALLASAGSSLKPQRQRP